MRSILLGMVILGSIALSSSVQAEARDAEHFEFLLPKIRDAHEHLRRGVRLYNNQSFEEAIAEFKAGALVEPCATFDYNLGQAYRQLGKYKEALWHYRRFLTYGKPTGEVLEAVQKWIAEMQTHLENPALTAPPREPASDTGQSPPPRSASVHTGSATPPRDISQRDASLRDDGTGSPNWVGWGVTASGIAAIGVAGYLLLRASSLDDQANSDPQTSRRNELHDQASTRRLAGAIVGVGGLALAATGAYILATHSPHRDRAPTATIDVGLTGRGVVVFGRF